MNGAASNELSAMHPTTNRSAASPRTNGRPSRMDPRIDEPDAPAGGGSRNDATTANTAKKLTVLRTNASS